MTQTDTYRDYVRRAVDSAPQITPQQRQRLTEILMPDHIGPAPMVPRMTDIQSRHNPNLTHLRSATLT